MSHDSTSPTRLSEAAVEKVLKDSGWNFVEHSHRWMRHIASKAAEPYQDRILTLEKEIADLKATVSERHVARPQNESTSKQKQIDITEALSIAANRLRSTSSNALKRGRLDAEDDAEWRANKRSAKRKLATVSPGSEIEPNANDSDRSQSGTSTKVDRQKTRTDLCVYVATAYEDDVWMYKESARVIGVYRDYSTAQTAAEKFAVSRRFKIDDAVTGDDSFEDESCKHIMRNLPGVYLDIEFPVDGNDDWSPQYKVSITKHEVKGTSKLPKKAGTLYLVLHTSSRKYATNFCGTEFGGAMFIVCGVFASRSEANEACKNEVLQYVNEWEYDDEVSEFYEHGLLIVNWGVHYDDSGGSNGPRIYYVEACNMMD